MINEAAMFFKCPVAIYIPAMKRTGGIVDERT
jgi:hypothetical protein